MEGCKIVSQAELQSKFAAIGPGKTAFLLYGGWDQPTATGAVVVDGVAGKFEVHEHKMDVWLITSGRGRFRLGGRLCNREFPVVGEQLAETAEDTEVFEVGAGDVLVIPPGVVHQTEALNGRFEAIVVKVPFTFD